MKHAIEHIHMVGIGGAGMSGIAEVLINLGYRVSGSDMQDNASVQRLRTLGARVDQGHRAEHMQGADVVVTSTAVQADNPEVAAAHAQLIPVVPRAVMLAELMRMKQGIAIAGTHGKTTTTSLTASVLAEAGLDPTFVIGGRLNSAGVNARLGGGDYIVVEADESDASFLNLSPVMAVVTNIDADHMDTYGHDFDRLQQAFVDFLHRMPFYGAAVVCIDDPHVAALLPRIARPLVTYGLANEAMVQALDIQAEGTTMRFVARRRSRAGLAPSRPDLPITLNLPGVHNVRNALAVVALADQLDISDTALQTALASFTGVGRRFQSYGELPAQGGGTFLLIDDYGHHPVEVAATLAATRAAFASRRLVLVFQPHRYSRTRDCFDDFVQVLQGADLLLLTEVYAAGEAPVVAADSRALARALRVAGAPEPVWVEAVEALPEAVWRHARDNDVVLCMGAGSIDKLPQALLQRTGQGGLS
ncbi:MAG: UDP-N-acetylmuramate--L-alanine ligase [Burkholderiaceae bacterium]